MFPSEKRMFGAEEEGRMLGLELFRPGAWDG
jgi:hypothetical protein